MTHADSFSSVATTDSGAGGRPLSVYSNAPSMTSSNTSHNSKGRATWAMRWSPCGRYLAVAGQDCVITIYEVLSTKAQRLQEQERARAAEVPATDAKSKPPGSTDVRNHFPVFSSTPVRELRGHKLDVLDISWSKNNFLLSASMDKTAKLWHISRDECLCTFAHLDFVVSCPMNAVQLQALTLTSPSSPDRCLLPPKGRSILPQWQSRRKAASME